MVLNYFHISIDFLKDNLEGKIYDLHAGYDGEASEEAEVATNRAEFVLQLRALVLGDPVKGGTL